MTRRILSAAVAAFGLCLGTIFVAQGYAAGGQSNGGPSNGGSRFPKNAAEFDQLFHTVSNWGRWGKADQLGAANLVTAAKQKQAATLVKQGISVSLDHDALTEAAADNPSPWEFTMNRGFSTDTLKINYHGYAHSHMDALCHISYKDQVYNGYPKAEVNTEKGCTKLGIERLKSGILTRGIIIDIPRLTGVPYLEAGVPIFTEDLDSWERKTGVKITAGDAVFVRTGRWARRAKVGPWKASETIAGLHASTVPWFKARDIAFLGGDGPQDVAPALVEGVNIPVHTLIIVSMGVYIFDQMDLEAVADTAARLNRWDFMFTAAPYPIVGGTGYPLNAIATF
jgi:kynurenine formamidase